MLLSRHTKVYLGDGVFATFDGWQIRLRTPRGESDSIYHTVVMHDDWCAHYDGCNCNPIVMRHVEPKRS
jgi:hypothetical protein